MGGYGRQNPWPFQWGGGSSPYEELWMGLRTMLGTNGAGPIGGLEDAWREAECAGLVAVTTMAERAALQALPRWATDHLGAYEVLLGLSAAGEATDRRDAARAAWVDVDTAINPALVALLTDIDSGLGVVALDPDHVATSHFGKAISTTGQCLPYLGSQWPNYSSDHVLHLLWTGLPSGIPAQDKHDEVEQLLNRALPAWVDFSIMNGQQFYLDGFADSRLDLTGFGT